MNAPSKPRGSATPPAVLTAEDMRRVEALADAIIPRTATPGAGDVGVPRFIHRAIAAAPGGADLFRTGMALLEAISVERFGVTYCDLSDGNRGALMSVVERERDTPAARFLADIKHYAVVGYYTSRAGLCEELGWRAVGARRTMKGCTHAGHAG